jgi:hypothetical protein
MKNILKEFPKYIGIIVIAVLVLYIGYVAGLGAKSYLEKWKMAKKVELFNNTIINMFKNDTYGGKTPEETYNLFVEALKKQDVDLAVKYFILDSERRARYQKEFSDKKQKGTLEKYANGFPKWEEFTQVKDQVNDWESQAEVWNSTTIDKSMMVYDPFLNKETEVLPGKYVQHDIIFTKNINIWKISTL